EVARQSTPPTTVEYPLKKGEDLMGKRRRSLGMVGLALTIALIAAACGSSGGGGSTGGTKGGNVQKGGVLRMAVDDFGYTNAFDPTGEYLGAAFAMYNALTRTLVTYNHL